jgi:exosortase D (VPLPA-CTERM-specific)
MSNTRAGSAAGPFRMPLALWGLLGAVALVAGFVFRDALSTMTDTWFGRPEYSHGVLIPVIAAFLIWQRQDDLAHAEYRGSWAGVVLVVLGILLHAVGHVATLFVVQQYSMLVVLYGIVLAMSGWQAFRILWVPLLLLVFMIPLPQFLLANFSAQLQLISSQIGVGVIRLFGISVHLEGNVIDLGQYRLQVAEACDGLRYLFPLMTLGFMMAYFYRAAFWKRAVLFLSSIPITILMNSFRIGVIGVTVEHWGVGMAEGFLHEFQGWAVFMASTAVMLLVMIALSRVGRDRGAWRDLFAVEIPRRDPARTRVPAVQRAVPVPVVVAAGLVATYAGALALLPERVEAVPLRPSFTTFPERLGPWVGRSGSLESVYLDALKLNDYYLGDFAREGASPVNLYVAWYDSQRSGQSAHSPRSCLPGGGWRINDLRQVSLAQVQGPQGPVAVNRALISSGNDRQLVYYWFQQRGRVVTNEYLVKWYLVWDALTRNRTDGALVRITTPLAAGEDPDQGDERLAEFAAQAVPRLSGFIPD